MFFLVFSTKMVDTGIVVYGCEPPGVLAVGRARGLMDLGVSEIEFSGSGFV